jgi:lipopolysaccharide/colanic/teichoic acid biosynthesis glycosyltransferase
MEIIADTVNIVTSEQEALRIIHRPDDVRDCRIPLDITHLKVMKRLLDIVLSVITILFVLSWMIPLFAIIIKVTSRGPVFFLQKRNGLNGRTFTCIKFRTMYANEESDVMPTCEGDARITPPGKFLRRYCLDEFPQFLNVLTGKMAIVGPRPHMVVENLKYERLIDDYSFRCRIKPGITGLAQVKHRAGLSRLKIMEERVFWDLHYIRNWSFYTDIRIICRTLVFIFSK